MHVARSRVSMLLPLAAGGIALLVAAFALAEPGGARPVHAAAPAVSVTEVTQSPPGGSVAALGSQISYTVSVTLTAGQAEALTIQLGGMGSIENRMLNCTSSSNGDADSVGSGGAPSCKWNGPVVPGTFTFVFSGTIAGPIGDAVPSDPSVVCTDTNASNTCNDEAPGNKTPLTDANGDVGPVILPGTVTPTNTATATATGTATATATKTATPTGTATPKPTYRAYAPQVARD